jgi:ribonucleoside-diphosphate reductase alpha chain
MRAASLYGLCGFGKIVSLEYYGVAVHTGNAGAAGCTVPAMTEGFPNLLAERVWRDRYRRAGPDGPERSVGDSLARVARALASVETNAAAWEARFRDALGEFRFLPGGRILAEAGAGSGRTLLNCFVMGPLDDSPLRLFRALGEGAETLRLGGGVGWDFSTLHPAGTPLGRRAVAPGPVACLELWDAACRTVTTGSTRGGAMMASLAADHPDIGSFISAKSRRRGLACFNLSVQVPDTLLESVRRDSDWALARFAAAGAGSQAVPSVPARTLWKSLLSAMLDWSEPGVLFTGTMDRENNLWWRERLCTTNPCGEVPLPAWGSCDLGSINLAALVRRPFTRAAGIDGDELAALAAVAVRMLDNVLDLARYPLARQRREARETRRIGLGITGLGDALAMLGLRYDSPRGREAAGRLVEQIKLAAYAASCRLAKEKGVFPAWEPERWLEGAFASRLPGRLRTRIYRHGLRNSHLLAIAPTGSISLLAGNVSPGIEPITARVQQRRTTAAQGADELEVEDRAWSLFLGSGRRRGAGVFVTADEVSPEAQVAMQAAVQPHVDGAISKTVLLPPGYGALQLGRLLLRAHRDGIKGITVHRAGGPRGDAIAPACAVQRSSCDSS